MPHRRQLHPDETQWGILIVAKGEKQLSPNNVSTDTCIVAAPEPITPFPHDA